VWQGERSAGTSIALRLLAGGVSDESIICNLLADCQARVAEAWQRGEWSIAGEHLATCLALETTFTRVPGLAVTDATRCASREPLDAVLRIVASATVASDPAVATDHGR
jgi:hypothetical protein